ncbi:MAG: hypothetical protein ACYCVV_09410 [Acidimicrobiales bacterium]
MPPRRRRRRLGNAAQSRPAKGTGGHGPRHGVDSDDSAPSPTHLARSAAASIPLIDDPVTRSLAELRRVQPFDARKQYICPGCNQEIRRGTGHAVVVPLSAPDLRRHWHNPCLVRARRHGLP